MQRVMGKANGLIRAWWKKALICLVLAIVVAVCLEWLQVKTWPIDPDRPTESMWKKNITGLSVFFFILFLFLAAIHGGSRLIGCLERARKGLTENPRRTLICFLLFILSGGLTYLVLRVYIPYLIGKPFNYMINRLCVTASIAVGCGVCFRKTIGRKPENFFVILCILVGSTIAVTEPAKMLSWDEQIHYYNAIASSYLGNIRLTEEDSRFVYLYGEESTDDLAETEAWHEAQNERFQSGVVSRPAYKLDVKNYWLFFSGIGLYIGRVLRRPYYQIVALGRMISVFAYAFFGWFAVRRLQYGKMIVSAVLMIPVCLFLAANYSYDPSVTVFLAIGFSYLFAEWQEPGQVMKWGNALIMIGALFLGCLTKAIYFPVLLLPLFMKRNKFTSRKAHELYIGLIFAAMLLLILSFMLPFLSSDGTGDVRAGEGINTFEQLNFILTNPLRYTEIMFHYLRSFLSPDGISGFITFFAYLGTAGGYNTYLILLAVLAFTDKDGTDYAIPGGCRSRWIMLAILLGTTVLFITSMYLVFSPVGLNTVNGNQPRYLLPLFFPAIMLLGSQKVVNKINKSLYNGVAFAFMGYIGYSAILQLIVRLYY